MTPGGGVPALRADGLGKRYGHVWALRDCTFSVPAGSVAGLVGPNGAAKTTLLSLAVGLVAPSEGAVLTGAGARTGEQILAWQTEMIAARLPPLARAVLRVTRTDVVRSQRKRAARLAASRADVVRIQGIRVNARWFRDFLAYDPRPVLARITVPVLAITGGQDVQVPRRTWQRSAGSFGAHLRVMSSAISAICSGPTPSRPARGTTAGRYASR